MRFSSACSIFLLFLLLGATAQAKSMKASDYFEKGPQRALTEAAGKGNTKEIEKLVSGGAVLNFQGKEGMTALIWSLLQQNKEGFSIYWSMAPIQMCK